MWSEIIWKFLLLINEYFTKVKIVIIKKNKYFNIKDKAYNLL